MQLSTILIKEHPCSLTSGITYQRRVDLSPLVRTKIALIANFGRGHGRITRLSARFGVSRTTVYAFRDQLVVALEAAFSPCAALQADFIALRTATIRHILLLRLTGHCTLRAISIILSQCGHKRDSIGFISETLHAIGDKLPSVIDYQGTIHWACDEIYHLGDVPILVSVEPLSGAVLQINRVAGSLKEGWLAHWQALMDKGIMPLSLVSDEGWLMKTARLTHADWDFQPDTFHAVSHRLGVFAQRLQKAAYQAIEAQNEREALFNAAHTDHKLSKFIVQWEEKQAQTQKAIYLYDAFSFLYGCLLQQFTIFNRHGLPRKRAFAEQEARCALEMMAVLDIKGLDKELKAIENLLPELYKFLDKAEQVCKKINQNGVVDDLMLPFWALAWQYDKKSYKIKNNYAYQKQLREQSKNWLKDIQQQTAVSQQEFNQIQATVFALFDGIIQSSASVEMFNAILRPFLNQSKDQLSQQALNLIMDFHNHKQFSTGKRKGKSPFEILTGKKQEQEWLDKMMNIVKIHNI